MDATTVLVALFLVFAAVGFFGGLLYEASRLVRKTSELVRDARRARDKIWLDSVSAVMQTKNGVTTVEVTALLALVEAMGVKR